jgi:preprotein translocase subunit Sec61beta
LALRHVGRIIKAMDPNTQLRDVVQVCFAVMLKYLKSKGFFTFLSASIIAYSEKYEEKFCLLCT